ncbi:MAG TPA: TaqI-like C-terminal specificity domain-containing protein, partial [Verrucomicrobiae bacterium]|nr:TaqI-like C-terminal specificity domain-containing protein [Verrucomicrobiae bacterium]
LVNGFALRNQKRSLDEITLASQQLLNRFLFSRMLETNQLIEWNKLARAYSHYEVFHGDFTEKTFAESLRESLFQEIKFKFNTELFEQPLLCDTLALDNDILSILVGHEPLSPDVAATCGFESGQGELIAFRHLYSYDFSLMSSDVMGAVYEKFLAHRLTQNGARIVIEDTDELRKKEGIYYTPRYIVDYIVAHTLGEKIKSVLVEAKTLLNYKNFKGAYDKICELSQIKVLDPAMGSGSFLLGAFDALVAAYNDYNAECEKQKRNGGNGHDGGDALFDAPIAKPRLVERLGTAVVTHNLFGVDLDAQAVEVAKLNLWIRLMAAEKDSLRYNLTDPRAEKKPRNLLPALSANFKRGNSLISDKAVAGEAAFDWQKEFPEIKGFDVVIGNPPYNMLQPHNTSEDVLAHLRQHYVKVEFKIDLFQLFLQRAVSFLKQGSYFGYIIPTTILNNVYAESLRCWLADQCCIERIAVSRNLVFADADVHTSILIFKRESNADLREKHEILTTDDFPESGEDRPVTYSRVRQSRFAEIPGHVWNILLNEDNASLITKLTTESIQLKTIATLNRGLITGNRDQYFAATKKSSKYVPIIEGGDVDRYFASAPSNFVLFERPESAGGCWDEEVHFAKHKIVVRQIAEKPMASLLQQPLAVTGNIFTIRAASLEDEFYLLGIINSSLTEFFWKTMFADFKTSFPQVTVFSLEQLPIKEINKGSKNELAQKKNLVANVKQMLEAQNGFHILPLAMDKKIHHSQRTRCNLAHYLQKDFADSLKHEILIDDVQRKGFVQEIKLDSAVSQITLSATVSEDANGTPQPLPVLRLEFKHDALRQFIYAALRQFLEDNSRKKKWTPGKKPEAIYSLIVNLLEPLFYFNADAGDNLRAIRDLMKSVAEESGGADLAMIESEIETLDTEIDARVYELYGLTEDEIKIVEGTGK